MSRIDPAAIRNESKFDLNSSFVISEVHVDSINDFILFLLFSGMDFRCFV